MPTPPCPPLHHRTSPARMMPAQTRDPLSAYTASTAAHLSATKSCSATARHALGTQHGTHASIPQLHLGEGSRGGARPSTGLARGALQPPILPAPPPHQLPDGESCPAAFHQHCLTPPVHDVPIHEWLCPACVRDVAMGQWRGASSDGYRHESRVGPCFQVASASLPAPRAQNQLSPDRGRGGVKVPLVEIERQLERSSAPAAVLPSARVARGAGAHSDWHSGSCWRAVRPSDYNRRSAPN